MVNRESPWACSNQQLAKDHGQSPTEAERAMTVIDIIMMDEVSSPFLAPL